MCSIAEQLETGGAVLIDMRAHQDPQAAFSACHDAWANATEIRSPDDTIPAHAAFGTCPFPSANLDPRPNGPNDIRRRLHHPVMEHLAHLKGFGCQKLRAVQCLDLLADRVAAPGFEGSHRDEAPGAPPKAVVLGGWYNMGPGGNSFTYCPGTHKGQSGSGGFSKLSKKDHKLYKDRMVTIVVPVGFLLLFDEKLVHMVAAKKPTFGRNMRLFMGFVVGPDVTGPINDDIEWALDNTGNFPRKSGQLSEAYPKLWWTNWSDKIKALTDVVKPELHVDGHRKGDAVTTVTRFINKRGDRNLPNPHPPMSQTFKDLFLTPSLVKDDEVPEPKRRRMKGVPVRSHRGEKEQPITLL